MPISYRFSRLAETMVEFLCGQMPLVGKRQSNSATGIANSRLLMVDRVWSHSRGEHGEYLYLHLSQPSEASAPCTRTFETPVPDIECRLVMVGDISVTMEFAPSLDNKVS